MVGVFLLQRFADVSMSSILLSLLASLLDQAYMLVWLLDQALCQNAGVKSAAAGEFNHGYWHVVGCVCGIPLLRRVLKMGVTRKDFQECGTCLQSCQLAPQSLKVALNRTRILS